MKYEDAIKGFVPKFGDPNHITASRLIGRRDALQRTLSKYAEKKAPKKLIAEMDEVERRVIELISPTAPKAAYTGA